MKKLCALMLSTCIAASAGALTGFKVESNQQKALTENCKSAYLMDYGSGECLYKENETARMPIASVCKVMTLTLVFDAINCGELALTDTVTVSENEQTLLLRLQSFPTSQRSCHLPNIPQCFL